MRRGGIAVWCLAKKLVCVWCLVFGVWKSAASTTNLRAQRCESHWYTRLPSPLGCHSRAGGLAIRTLGRENIYKNYLAGTGADETAVAARTAVV